MMIRVHRDHYDMDIRGKGDPYKHLHELYLHDLRVMQLVATSYHR